MLFLFFFQLDVKASYHILKPMNNDLRININLALSHQMKGACTVCVFNHISTNHRH